MTLIQSLNRQLKENEHRDIECVSANTFIIELFFEQQDDNK